MPEKMKTILVAVIALSIGVGGWMVYSNYKEGQDAIKKLNFIQQQNQMQQRQSRQNINEQMEKQNSDPNVMTGLNSNDANTVDGQTMSMGIGNGNNNGQQQMMGGINTDSGMSELNSQFAEQAKKMQEEYNKSVEAMNQQSMQEYNKQMQEMQQPQQTQNQGMSQWQSQIGFPEMPSVPQAQMPSTPSMPMQDITNGNMDADITSDASVTVNKMDYDEMNSNNKDALVNKESQQTPDSMATSMGTDIEVESILTN